MRCEREIDRERQRVRESERGRERERQREREIERERERERMRGRERGGSKERDVRESGTEGGVGMLKSLPLISLDVYLEEVFFLQHSLS